MPSPGAKLLLRHRPAVGVAGASYVDHGDQALSDSGDATTWTASVSSDGPHTFIILTVEANVSVSGTPTLGGSNMSTVVSGSGATKLCYMLYIAGSAASATFSVTFSGSITVVPEITVVSIDGIDSATPVDTDSDVTSVPPETLELAALTGPGAGGIILVGGIERNNGDSIAFTNVTAQLSDIDTGGATQHRHGVAVVLGDPAGNIATTTATNARAVAASFT